MAELFDDKSSFEMNVYIYIYINLPQLKFFELYFLFRVSAVIWQLRHD